MPNTTTSPNMSLIVPTVGVDPGPDWALNLNASLAIIDSHNHSPGQGVQITPSGMNINADLSFNSNNATVLRSVRFTSQSSPLSLGTDIGCLYESGVDLYYNDGLGNQIRITQSGGVAGTPGSITGLVAPASATYVPLSQTFVWQQDVNKAANMDMASILLRNTNTSSNAITISAPGTLPSNYTLTLPSAQAAATVALTINASGVISFQSPNIVTYDAVIGSAAQVTNKVATHSTFASAIAAVSANGTILVLSGAFTENVTVNKSLNIFGSGYGTAVTGTLSITGSNYCNIKRINFSGNISIDSSSAGNQITECYIGGSSTATDSGTGNYIELIQG